MRPIKFRAWDGEHMMEWGFTEPERFQGPPSTGNANPFTSKQMQFTGLHDKNGKEIWEGDIVKVLSDDDEIGIGKVSWDVEAGMWAVDPNPEHNLEYVPAMGHFCGSDAWNIEVLGNIYENPELLKP